MPPTTARRRSLTGGLATVLAVGATLVSVQPAEAAHDSYGAEVLSSKPTAYDRLGEGSPALPMADATGAGGGTGCLVPELRGLRLRVARTELEWANCSLGAVRTKRAAAWKRGYVLKQSVPANSVRRAGFPVKVVVGR